jgi:hypothetical protein
MLSLHVELIASARRLLCADENGLPPARGDLRRAVSAAYYAIFHHASCNCSILIAGNSAKHLTRAKSQIYRSLNHRDILDACRMAKEPAMGFPQAIRAYAGVFLNMYKSRCNADYDPSEAGDFFGPQVLNQLGEIAEAIRRFDATDEDDRRAFAILIAVKRPRK